MTLPRPPCSTPTSMHGTCCVAKIDSFGSTPSATRSTMARIWLVSGAMASMQGAAVLSPTLSTGKLKTSLSPGFSPAKQYLDSVTSATILHFIFSGRSERSFFMPGDSLSRSASVMLMTCLTICRDTSSTLSLLLSNKQALRPAPHADLLRVRQATDAGGHDQQVAGLALPIEHEAAKQRLLLEAKSLQPSPCSLLLRGQASYHLLDSHRGRYGQRRTHQGRRDSPPGVHGPHQHSDLSHV